MAVQSRTTKRSAVPVVEMSGITVSFASGRALEDVRFRLFPGEIHGLVSRGIRVPEDVSVVGFDDLPTARHFLPPLTTVKQDFDKLGSTVAEVIHARIRGQEIPQRTRIPTELIVRESTAAPRS